MATSDKTRISVLHVFVASPKDAQSFRDRLPRIIERINKAEANTDLFQLKLLREETDVFSDIDSSGPQSVIDRQIPDYDILLGIFRTHFGTPTRDAGSGTEAEFNRALFRYLNNPRSVLISFYFNNALIHALDSDAEQLYKIQEFRRRIGELGVLWKPFDDEAAFDTLVYDGLNGQARALLQRRASSAGVARVQLRALPSAVNSWHATTFKTNPQWASYKEIALDGAAKRNLIISGVFCSPNPYFRFGFKFSCRTGRVFGDGAIQSSDNNFLIHIGKNKDSQDLFLTKYRNGIRLEEDVPLFSYADGRYLKIEVTINADEWMTLSIDGKQFYETILFPSSRDRVFLLAWGDNHEYVVDYTDILVRTD
jgi:hypothetical protein